MTPEFQHQRRELLRRGALTRFIPVDEFMCRAMSRQTLSRVVDELAGLQGLYDPASGFTFYVEEEKLFRARALA